jgi:signal transduction histidine kinase
VFFNILTNAIKFAPKSSVIIVSMKTTNVDVRISIQDQGPGVFPGEVGNLFKRFFRAKSARNHEKLGYGLGLAICKNIIDHHNGTIGYERTPEAGTTFFVILPIGPKLPED